MDRDNGASHRAWRTVDANLFANPFFGKNLRAIPGTDYPEGKIFGYLPMSEVSPYRCSWWYRKEFSVQSPTDRSLLLRFDGVNYRANLWLNGKQGSTETSFS